MTTATTPAIGRFRPLVFRHRYHHRDLGCAVADLWRPTSPALLRYGGGVYPFFVPFFMGSRYRRPPGPRPGPVPVRAALRRRWAAAGAAAEAAVRRRRRGAAVSAALEGRLRRRHGRGGAASAGGGGGGRAEIILSSKGAE
jgi:hypothetical protein